MAGTGINPKFCFLIRRLFLPLARASHRRQNRDSPFSLTNLPTQFLPSAIARHASGSWPLHGDEQRIAQAVLMKSAHRRQKGRQAFAMPVVQGQGQLFQRPICQLLRFFTFHFPTSVPHPLRVPTQVNVGTRFFPNHPERGRHPHSFKSLQRHQAGILSADACAPMKTSRQPSLPGNARTKRHCPDAITANQGTTTTRRMAYDPTNHGGKG